MAMRLGTPAWQSVVPDRFEASRTLETGLNDREDNMRRFAIEALDLLHAALA
jgi:nicotinamide-nucleotide amidase